ncbi:lipopolysaccharide biosynthesis protein [Flavobacterium agrisoli]|uniref:Oligosaccharide flippase family protein n=1 Tax=Flavobacterium agrisoli TaxID=2793066 RepID=A0A934PPC3_9FLAO|nr:oligosaccharide flippase family protein [Flavobacterium agrisoli]MBK0371272.1 oligosaccharide flippase family protein [Flavobacterium agrisoli]
MANNLNLDFIFKFFKNKDRSKNIQANIIGSFFLKGISILLSLVVVPLTMDYITPYQYGIWVTLSSVIGWLSFFDIGFGNGLKNKFVEAITHGNIKLAKMYVSTTYAIITIIISIIWIVSLFLSRFINWNEFLNVDKTENIDLLSVVHIVITTFAFQFILGLLNTILVSIQKPVITSVINVTSQVLILVGIFVLMNTHEGSLTSLSMVMGGANTLVLLLFSLYFFNTSLAKYSPSIKYIEFKYTKDLLKIGVNFFILQIIAIVYYETNNIIITKTLSPLEVTVYNLAFKYMSILGMGFTIILTPFWSAFIEASVLKDYDWMKKVKKTLYKAFFIFVILGIFLILMSPLLYKLWFGDRVKIPMMLTILMGIWQLCNIWNSLHSTLIYGFNKIKLQLICSIVVGLVNIPLTIFLCKKLGLTGVTISQIFLVLLISWVGPIQLNKLLNEKARGIWNK